MFVLFVLFKHYIFNDVKILKEWDATIDINALDKEGENSGEASHLIVNMTYVAQRDVPYDQITH